MQYILARYTGDSAFDIVMDGVTVLMYIALTAIIALLVVYACTPVKWKKAYRLLHFSVYLAPLVYVILFLTFRSYISAVLIVGIFCCLSHLEKKELGEIATQYEITDRSDLKASRKVIIVLATVAIALIMLLYLYFRGVTYLP